MVKKGSCHIYGEITKGISESKYDIFLIHKREICERGKIRASVICSNCGNRIGCDSEKPKGASTREGQEEGSNAARGTAV